MNYLTICILWLCTLCQKSYGAKILCIFPTPSYSHQMPMLGLSHALARKGHDLTVITANPSKVPIKNHRDIDISHGYELWDKMKDEKDISLQKRITHWDMTRMIQNFADFFTTIAFESDSVKDLMKEVNGTKFDLIIYESLCYSPFLGFAELVGNPPIISIITIQPFYMFDYHIGNPLISSYVPNILLPYTDKMSFWERFNNFYLNLYSFYITTVYIKPNAERLLTKYFGKTRHTAEELEANKSLVIISSDLTSGYSKPIHQNMIYVGPLHLTAPREPLPEDLKKWLDEAKNGVIYFSMGSNMKGTSVDQKKRDIFIKVFNQFTQYKVLWKWESETELPGKPSHVLTRKWIPQHSLLAHPNVKVFISQMGLQSMQETTYFGVPVLAIPMFADQDFNAKRLTIAGAARCVEFMDITYENIYENLKELLTNSSYKENILRLSSVMKDTPFKTADTAVWWVEYVLRHNGAPHLRPSVLDLYWFQYIMLDIILVSLAPLILVLIVIKKVTNKVFYKSDKKVKTS